MSINKMTGIILKINGVKDAVAVEFYTERERSVRFEKKDLIRVFTANGEEYYAYIDADLGRGNLMASVEFIDKEAGFDRPVTVNGFTGISIPCMGTGNTISCGDYEVTFEVKENIPLNEGTMIYAGVINEPVESFGAISEEVIKRLPAYEPEARELRYSVRAGMRLVIAIPLDRGLTAVKDNGVGGRVSFSTSVMGANGLEILIDGVRHLLFGEFIVVEGTRKVYIA